MYREKRSRRQLCSVEVDAFGLGRSHFALLDHLIQFVWRLSLERRRSGDDVPSGDASLERRLCTTMRSQGQGETTQSRPQGSRETRGEQKHTHWTQKLTSKSSSLGTARSGDARGALARGANALTATEKAKSVRICLPNMFRLGTRVLSLLKLLPQEGTRMRSNSADVRPSGEALFLKRRCVGIPTCRNFKLYREARAYMQTRLNHKSGRTQVPS